jgi:hypothetical protein
MGEIFREFFDKSSDIIREAGQSSLAFAALCVLVIGIVGVLLFRKDIGKLKLAG